MTAKIDTIVQAAAPAVLPPPKDPYARGPRQRAALETPEQRKAAHEERVARWKAITEAGEIILVIAAGGALGGALRQAGMAELSHGFASGSGIALIPIAWAITAVIRVAQGSATVAMITAGL